MRKLFHKLFKIHYFEEWISSSSGLTTLEVCKFCDKARYVYFTRVGPHYDYCVDWDNIDVE